MYIEYKKSHGNITNLFEKECCTTSLLTKLHASQSAGLIVWSKTVTENWVIEAPSVGTVGTILAYLKTSA